MVLAVPASVRPFDAMNGMSSSLWPSRALLLHIESSFLREAGIQGLATCSWPWTPAFAGVTWQCFYRKRSHLAADLGPTGTGMTFMRRPLMTEVISEL